MTTGLTFTAAELRGVGLDAGVALSDAALVQRASAASALVAEYGGGSSIPEPIAREAVYRIIGYLQDRPPQGGSQTDGDFTWSVSPTSLSAWRHSGAAALVAPFRRQRIGLV